MNAETIRARLTSENPDILRRSLSFLDNRLALMRDRAKVAETRATAMLVVSGILAGFVVNFGKALHGVEYTETLLLSAFYFSSIFLLIKAIFYGVKVLWVLKGYELNPDLAFDLQGRSGIDSLREELTWKIWEYWQILPLTNEKLFWLNRSQRNTVSAIITFMFLGGILFIQMKCGIHLPSIVTVSITVILTALVLFIDVLMERFGKLWRMQQ
jgi:hypothetical protein